jgi:hypothetical protein
MNIEVGDTVVIRGIVESIRDDVLNIITPDEDRLGILCSHKNRVAEVIKAPVIPKAGETWVWVFDNVAYECTIVWADEKTTVFDRAFSTRTTWNTPEFIENHKKA